MSDLPEAPTEADRFDAFRDAHPGWERLSPYEVARLFWAGGRADE